MKSSVPVAKAWPFTTQWPPPVPLFHRSYRVIASPSLSLALNRLAAATAVSPFATTTFDDAGVTVGLASIGAVTVNELDQSLQNVPSLTRTHRVSGPEPL